MLNHKLKNLQRFLQEVSDTAFEFTSLNSEFTAIPTTYDEHFQTVLSARSEELSQLLHEIALEQAFSQNSIILVDGVDDIIIKGANNSSFTIKTSLINTTINLNKYGITKDFGGNNSVNLNELTPDAIGVDFNASASLFLGGNIGVNILWHTRGEQGSDKYYPEVHTYAGISKGTNIGAGASVGVFAAWARDGQGGQAESSWVANGLNWTGKFDSASLSLGGVSGSCFSSKNYSDGNYWEGIQLSYSPTKWGFGASGTGFKALKSVLDEPRLSGDISTTSYYMIYGNGSDYLENGTDISGLHLLNPIDPTDDK